MKPKTKMNPQNCDISGIPPNLDLFEITTSSNTSTNFSVTSAYININLKNCEPFKKIAFQLFKYLEVNYFLKLNWKLYFFETI